MANGKKWLLAHLPTRRRLIQLYAALLYNAHLRGFVEGKIYTGGTKFLCVPGLNCYSCPGAVGACPLGSLQNALASSRSRAPFYALGMLMLFGLVLGRVVCGFLCPFGLIQEWIHKLPVPKLRKGRVTRALSYVKYVLLALLVVLIPLYYAAQRFPLPAFCKYICPAGTLEGAVTLLAHPENEGLFSMLGELFTGKFAILAAVLAACAFVYRAFCRFFCPLGAIYGFFCRIALLGVKVDPDLCTNCGLCVRKCPMDVRRVGDHECIHCGACIGECPTKAIRWRGARRGKAPHRWVRIAAWCAALAVLAGAIWFFNKPETTGGEVQPQAAVSASPAVDADNALQTPVPGRADGANLAEATAIPGRTAADADNALQTPVPGRADGANLAEATAIPGRMAADADDVPQASVPGREGEANLTEATAVPGRAAADGADPADADGEVSGLFAAATGSEVGMQCPDFTVPLYGGGEFHLSEARGKVVVLNFWATWCSPCCAELPYFEQLWENYPDDVALVAIHSSLVTDDVPSYIEEMGYEMPFALDETGEVIASLGGSTMLPQTVILDREGTIVYNRIGSVTYEDLEQWVLLAME
ncbi:MAG TPA: redoxin domain-containing protein [Candidatus Faecivicinus avistercoris]|nr:redoxin domain-containing protein [Candidatus Faecivicinus avistercoris]